MNSYKNALNELNVFINNNILSYSKNRNYDHGPSKRDNVSMLSKYITHRIISEYDIVSLALAKNSYSSIEKYIQEVFWRIYWKGWLEHRPSVWEDYFKFNDTDYDIERFKSAENSNTDIECFNFWMDELKSRNYLHNHTRMWFASIWIFTLKLPWQLGANLFMKYLYDGDAASNTLSWRWVAGLQTIGKHYVATSENISKYTNRKFNPTNLNEYPKPINSDKVYDIGDLKYSNCASYNDSLIIFENNLDYINNKKLLGNYKKILLLLLDNDDRKLKICNNVLSFKYSLIDEYSKTIPNSQIISSSELRKNIGESSQFDIIYPGVGENLSYLKKLKFNSEPNYICNENDIFCWKFAKKGFFNFKKNIPTIINKIIP